jgi:hypothetical protein
MIARCFLSLFATIVIVAVLAFLGWGVAMLIEHHLRFVVGFAICALAAIFYVEIGPASMEHL